MEGHGGGKKPTIGIGAESPFNFIFIACLAMVAADILLPLNTLRLNNYGHLSVRLKLLMVNSVLIWLGFCGNSPSGSVEELCMCFLL